MQDAMLSLVAEITGAKEAQTKDRICKVVRHLPSRHFPTPNYTRSRN